MAMQYMRLKSRETAVIVKERLTTDQLLVNYED
jgi:hypothetical protein